MPAPGFCFVKQLTWLATAAAGAVLVKLSYVPGIPDVLTSGDIDIFVDINTSNGHTTHTCCTQVPEKHFNLNGDGTT